MLFASRTSRIDPSGLSRAEAFWNSLGPGLRPGCLGQFQFSFSAESRWGPAPPAQVAKQHSALPLWGVSGKRQEP